MMKVLPMVLAAALLQPVIAMASNWEVVASTSVAEVAVERESMRRTGSKVKVWTRWKFAQPQPHPAGGGGKPYSLIKSLDVYDCDERTTTNLQQAWYEADAETVVGSNSTPDVRFKDVVPDSVGEIILKFSCGAIKAR